MSTVSWEGQYERLLTVKLSNIPGWAVMSNVEVCSGKSARLLDTLSTDIPAEPEHVQHTAIATCFAAEHAVESASCQRRGIPTSRAQGDSVRVAPSIPSERPQLAPAVSWILLPMLQMFAIWARGLEQRPWPLADKP